MKENRQGRRALHALRSSAWLAILIASCNTHPPSARDASSEPDEPHPKDAVQAILEAFDKFPIVALGEAHGLKEEQEFIESLIRHPDFPIKANTIVVEAGNARHQDVMDRYVSGQAVAPDELRQVWRNHTCTALGPLDAVINEHFFATVRTVNQTLPESRQLRVLAGDPPIDWSQIRSRDDFFPWLEDRDTHYAAVVEQQVLAQGRKALLIAGTTHFDRQAPEFVSMPGPGPSNDPDSDAVGFPSPAADPDAFRNVVQIIERRHPGMTLVITPHLGFGDRSAELEPRLASWPRPSLAMLRGTWLGAIGTAQVSVKDQVVYTNGELTAELPVSTQTLADVADAYLYLGSYDSLTMVQPPTGSLDDNYLSELDRRHQLVIGQPLDRSLLLKEKPKRYRDNFQATYYDQTIQWPRGNRDRSLTNEEVAQ